jgi:prepilin-type N-terminal cleavage/methylation domain-containing protein
MTSKGFTLIETLVAVTLLATAIAGPLTIAAKGLSAALIAKDQISAFYLAQDAMEYIRYKRDSNCLAAAAAAAPCTTAVWLTGLVGSGLCSADATTACSIDSLADTVAACSPAPCAALNYDPTNKYFSYTSGTATSQQYRRSVTILTPVGTNSDEVLITIKVEWRGVGGILHAVTIKENMLRWQ